MTTGSRLSPGLLLGAGLLLLAAAGGQAAKAQWLPPIGAAPPSEIVERLRAQGFVPTGPLIRRDTVYLADVKGPAGHERLVLDAWSGAILQSFISRGRNWRPGEPGYVVGGGEFDSPPPLSPPSKRDFLDPSNGFAYGAPGAGYHVNAPEGFREPQRPTRAHRRPTTAPLPAEPASSATSTAGNAGPGPPPPTVAPNPPASAASPGAPAPASPSAAPSGPPAAATSPSRSPAASELAPKTTEPTPAAPAPAVSSPSVAATQRPIPPPKPASPGAAAPVKPATSDKSKVNDVPVNPLD